MTEIERKNMLILADTIKGEINRMCITKDIEELISRRRSMCAKRPSRELFMEGRG